MGSLQVTCAMKKLLELTGFQGKKTTGLIMVLSVPLGIWHTPFFKVKGHLENQAWIGLIKVIDSPISQSLYFRKLIVKFFCLYINLACLFVCFFVCIQ